MQPLSSLFGSYKFEPIKTRRTKRGDLIDDFLKQLNPPRLNRSLKPLSHGFLSKFFSDRKMDEDQIYCFFKDCERAKNFSSYFWYATKPKQLSTVDED